jgi:hypothetical protein
LGSGFFNFESSDAPDTELEVLRLFNDFNLTESDNTYVPFINFGVGTAKLTDKIPPIEGTGENDFSTINTDSAGLGAGIDIKLSDNWILSPQADLIYSHSKSRYDYNNQFSQEILQIFDGNLFNWDVETLSYNPGAKIEYQNNLGCGVTILPSLQYTQIFVESVSTNSDLIDVSSSSGVLSSRLRAEVEDVLKIGQQSLTFIPQFSRTDLYHDARADLGINYFHEFSIGLLAKNQQSLPIFKDLGLSAGYTFGEDMNGWRIGLDANL